MKGLNLMNSAKIKFIKRISLLFLTLFLSLCLTACSPDAVAERIAGRIIREIIARDYDLIYGTESIAEEAYEDTEKKQPQKDRSSETGEDDTGDDTDEEEDDDEEPSEPEDTEDLGGMTLNDDEKKGDTDSPDQPEDEGADAVSDNGTAVAEQDLGEDEEENEKAYYFSVLDNDKKKLYLEIYNAIVNMDEKVTLSSKEPEEVDRIFNICLMDHPEIFYCDGYSTNVLNSGEDILSIGFTGRYNTEKKDRKEKEDRIKSAADDILKKVPEDDSEYEKVKYIYDWIIDNTEYNLEAPDNQNITSVFLNHSSVCQGYTMATKYLLDRLGIFCTVVYGSASDESHSWNLVKIDGTYCYVDTTWGDSSYRDINNGQANRKSYNYFGCNSEILLRTHTIAEKEKLPECTSLDEYYYVKEAKYFTKVDNSRLKAVFDHELEINEKVFTIRASDEEVYNGLYESLFTNQEIFNLVPEADKVTYIEDKTEYTLTFNL